MTGLYSHKKNGKISRLPMFRKLRYSPAQVLLNRLYPDLPEFQQPDQFEDVTEADWIPLIDLIENVDSLVIKVEIPGVEKENVAVTIKDDVLWIRGERLNDISNSVVNYCCENNYGTFTRSIRLPQNLDLEKTKSELKNGILTIIISKKKENNIKEIDIK